MLQRILLELPVRDLLPLRFLCRRFKDVVLNLPLWRARRLRAHRAPFCWPPDPREEQVNAGLLRAILLRAPKVHHVGLALRGESAVCRAAVRALAKRGACQVRILSNFSTVIRSNYIYACRHAQETNILRFPSALGSISGH